MNNPSEEQPVNPYSPQASAARPFWKKKRWVILAILLALPVFLYWYFWLDYGPYRWNQKLTVVVETPQGIKTGSSVVSVSWRKNDPIGAANGAAWIGRVKGEATVVDLGSGRYVFALLKNAKTLAFKSVIQKKRANPAPEELNEIRNSIGRVFPIAPSDYPLLVTFEDINDPASVMQVDPNDLSVSFGPDITLKSITLEIAEEPVTEDVIETVLEWLGMYPETGLCKLRKNLNPIPLCRQIKNGSFIRR
ncbi:MAG: hypothetical protein AAF478_02790 [Pseudomonadota bacterium]